ncbi:alpha/beta hydrolase [Dyella tabacisoli]|uniref:Alpha/beta hydrolase n=1 Tax=Dyella tabacisoli TaxID=2282381 RepID=A0A369UQ34_9GAMM|nr:alpha/beta hydrolase [Dyella tabacisoli]RDD81730.1 alpha/beta hydrolase [Dyella tabacisoli]
MNRTRRQVESKRHGAAALLKLSAVRAGFALGSRIAPTRTVNRAARLFSTPFASSRKRAASALSQTDAQRGEIIVDGTRIATYTWGDPAKQPYALLVHGWSSFGLRFQPWIKQLRAMGLAVITFDQPGHGDSGGRYCTLPDFVNTVREIGRVYGTAALAVGHSLGGTAVTLAQDENWHAQRLILIAPAADPVAATRRFTHFVHLSEHLSERLHDRFKAISGVSIHDLQVHRHLPRMGQPALIVHDLDDREVPWEEGERYARHWSGARLLTTQGLGHHKVLDATEVVDAAFAFLHGKAVGERVIASPNLPFGLA